MSKKLPPIVHKRSPSKLNIKLPRSPSISNLNSRSSTQTNYNSQSLNISSINENSFAKLYEPVQRINRLKLKMSSECSTHADYLDSSTNTFSSNDQDTKNHLSQVTLINLELKNQNQINASSFNGFKPARRLSKTRTQLAQIDTKKLNTKSSDWSRKSLFELPDTKEFLNSQYNRQVEMLMTKYKPESQYENSLTKSNLLLSHLLLNPKVDHKKLLNYMKKNRSYLPLEVNKQTNIENLYYI
jgi:hypothetical protein